MQGRKFSATSVNEKDISGLNADKTKDWLNYQKIYFVTESSNIKRKFAIRSNKDSTDKILFPGKWERKALHQFLARAWATEGYKRQPTTTDRDMLKNFHLLR